MVENLNDANKELIQYGDRQRICVRTPRRGRSKSITICSLTSVPRIYPFGLLNRYNKKIKRHLRPLIMINDLESIDEDGGDQLSDQPNRQNSNLREEEKA